MIFNYFTEDIITVIYFLTVQGTVIEKTLTKIVVIMTNCACVLFYLFFFFFFFLQINRLLHLLLLETDT